jgi:hypothetical protein
MRENEMGFEKKNLTRGGWREAKRRFRTHHVRITTAPVDEEEEKRKQTSQKPILCCGRLLNSSITQTTKTGQIQMVFFNCRSTSLHIMQIVLHIACRYSDICLSSSGKARQG